MGRMGHLIHGDRIDQLMAQPKCYNQDYTSAVFKGGTGAPMQPILAVIGLGTDTGGFLFVFTLHLMVHW